MLSEKEIRRYSRHIRMVEIGEKGQEKLKQAKVLVVGAGGLGCPILQYLTAAGVGTIGILDYDTVDESNLQRQILFTPEDIDKPKALVAKEKLSKQNPFVNFNIHFLKLTKKNALDIFNDYDIIVEGSDNFPTRYLTNDACVILKKPLVYGAIEKFYGQITVFNYLNGPTLRCLAPEPPDPLEIPSCSDVGVMGVMPGIIGTMQACEVIKIITGVGNVLNGRLLLVDALNFNFDTIELEKNPDSDTITELKDYTDFCTNETTVKKISAKELRNLLDCKEKIVIIDLRDEDDTENFSIATDNIPLGEISKNIHKIP